MRVLCLISCLALASGCASYHVRCDSRLRPINPRQPPAPALSSTSAPTVKP